MSDDPKLPAPQRTPPPYQNGAEGEPITGVFTPRTGRTRRMVKWGAIIAAATTLLTPIANAIALRIAGPARVTVVAPPAPDAGR